MPSIQVPSTSAEIASDVPARLTYAFLEFWWLCSEPVSKLHARKLVRG